MRTRLILRPGQRGTKRLVAQYGDRLVCVRYRYDAQQHKRYKTIELIVSEADWAPAPPSPHTIVAVRVAFSETKLRTAIKAAGGRWDQARRVWRLSYGEVAVLDLVDRIVADGF